MEFVGTVTKGLLCSACTKPWEPEAAKQCSGCEAIHCSACLSSGCQGCKKEDTTFVNVPRLVRQLAESAKVCCPNKAEGCEWTGTRTDFKSHLCKQAAPSYLYVDEVQIPGELQCTMCCTPFVDPVQLPCEHVFCKTCITTSLSKNQECPVDRQPANESQLGQAPKMIQSMLDELPVFCTYKKNECDWVGPRSDVKKHVQDECTKKVSTTTEATAPAGSTKMVLEPFTEFKCIDAKDTTQDIYAMAHMVAPRLKDLSERKKPLSISAVIDVSGSMAGGKLEMAKESLKFMIDELTDRDELGIIAFHTEIAETITLTKMDELGKERCRQAADSLRPLNRTNLSGGLFAGMDQVQHLPFAGAVGPTTQRPRMLERRDSSLRQKSCRVVTPPPAGAVARASVPAPDTCRAVLLFTDGIANGGLTDEAQFKQALQGKLNHQDTKDMVVHTFGFGADHNAKMLQGLAEIASGSYYYIQDVATMKESFADCLGGLLSTVAQNIRLSIKAEPGFQVEKVLTSFKQETKDAVTTVAVKDVYSTEKRDVLVKLKLCSPMAVSSNAAAPLVHFSVKYDSLLSGATETVSAQCKILPADAKDAGEPNQTILEQRTRIETTEALAAARAQADAGDAIGAQMFMKKRRADLKAQCKDSPYVAAMMDDMDEVAEAMDDQTMWCASGSKAMAQVQSCHEQQRMNRCSEAKTNLGYDNEWKANMRSKSRKN